MFKGIQTMPFFLYNMYSRDHQPKDSVAVFLIRTPAGYYDHKQLSGREQEMLMNPPGYYDNLRKDGDGILLSVDKRFKGKAPSWLYDHAVRSLYNDTARLDRFAAAWARYYREVGDTRYDSVTLVKSYISRQSPFRKSAADSVLFTVKIR